MREEQKFEMAGDENSCPKCGLEAKSMMHRFCQHSPCPVRDLLGLKKQEGMVVDAMLNQPKKTEAESVPPVSGGGGEMKQCEYPGCYSYAVNQTSHGREAGVDNEALLTKGENE